MYNTVSCYMLILPLPPEDFYLNPSLSNSLLNRYLMRLSMLLALRLNYVIQVSGLPIMVSFFFKLERGEGREREGEKQQCARDTHCLLQASNLGACGQPRHVP